MFQINHLSVTHTRDLRSMVSDFSLVLQPGDKAAVIGEEGNGKSTLLKLLYDESLVSGYTEWSGEILRGRTRMGYLPQELPSQALGEAVRTFWKQGPSLSPRRRKPPSCGLWASRRTCQVGAVLWRSCPAASG